MITAVDTNILLDVFSADPHYVKDSQSILRSCLAQGVLIACEVVWAETGAFFPNKELAVESMNLLQVEFSPIQIEMALAASSFWKKYRKRGGSRVRILPDFLIGAHALSAADRLLTRDSRFYRQYFTGLKVVNP